MTTQGGFGNPRLALGSLSTSLWGGSTSAPHFTEVGGTSPPLVTIVLLGRRRGDLGHHSADERRPHLDGAGDDAVAAVGDRDVVAEPSGGRNRVGRPNAS